MGLVKTANRTKVHAKSSIAPLVLYSFFLMVEQLFLQECWSLAGVLESCRSAGVLQECWSLAGVLESCSSAGVLQECWSLGAVLESCSSAGVLQECWSLYINVKSNLYKF